MRLVSRKLRVLWVRFLAPGVLERDPEFRKTLESVALGGMRAAGVLGLGGASLYVLAHVIAGHSLVWSYSGIDPEPHVVLWNKILIAGLGIGLLIAAQYRLGLRAGRLVMSLFLMVAAFALIWEDMEVGDFMFTAGWLTLVMFFAVGTVPFQPWQTGVLCASIAALYAFFAASPSVVFGGVSAGVPVARLIFLGLVSFLCVTMSSAIYVSRCEQYRSRRRAERLKERLSARSRELQRTVKREKALIDDLTEQSEKLVEMDRLKSRFFANVSHEFRTPLTLIIGPLEDLLARSESGLAAGARPQLEVMHRSARSLQRLISQLLDLSKLEAGRMRLRARPDNIVRKIRGIVSSFASYADRKQIGLDFHSTSDEIDLYFDADMVEKMVFNLLSNSFKFTPENGKIRVTVTDKRTAGTVEIAVKDSGPGIPENQLVLIFDRFRQAPAQQGQTQEGTGIGLALVKELMEQHGGNVRVESDRGFGSEFTITFLKGLDHLREDQIEDATLEIEEPARASLPLYEPSPSEEVRMEQMSSAEAEEKPSDEVDTVLVVDDNTDMRAYLRECLEGEYHVVQAQNGQEGLDMACEFVPDLIIADVMMPVMDGFALCRAVKTDDVLSHIPVILLSALTSDESTIEGLETGADDYLFKPFNAQALTVRVRNLIELRRTLRARFSREMLPVRPSEVSVVSTEEKFIDGARQVVEEHMGESSFDINMFAEALNMSSRQLQRKLRALTGQRPTDFVRLIRLQRAAQLLEQHAGTVSEIAYSVGFNYPEHFTKCFRELYGIPPSVYADGTA